MTRVCAARGATVIELIVSVAIFAIALGGIFLLFRKGYQSYHYLEKRQSLQVEMLKIKAYLKADFQLSHFRSIDVTTRVGTYVKTGTQGSETMDVRRDNVSCLILDDWRNKSNYHNVTLAPRWNQYAAYITQADRTTLVRRVFQTGSEFPVQPLPSLTAYGVVQSQLLSENLVSLEGELNFDSRDLLVEIELGRSLGSRGIDDKRSFESYEGIFRFTPLNTQPKL